MIKLRNIHNVKLENSKHKDSKILYKGKGESLFEKNQYTCLHMLCHV